MKHAAILALVFTVAALLVRNKISRLPWGYDEADYMYAASLGIGNNWVDSGTMPLTKFIGAGRSRGADPTQQAALSAMARSGDDPIVYRHWHGPLYFYYLTAVSALHLDEHATRIFSLVLTALAALVMYFGSLRMLGGAEGQVAAILSIALFLWSPLTLETTELAPHILFVLLYASLLLLLTYAATGGGKRYYYAAVCCAGLAFCTLEVAFVDILVVGIFAWRYRGKLGGHLIRNSIGIFLATVFIVWPTAFLKLSFAKAYLVMAYFAVFRKGAWGNVTFIETWIARFHASPVEWCLIVAALVLFFVSRRETGSRARTGAALFLLFAGLMILATIKVYTDVPRYMTPFFAALELFAAWTIAPPLARVAQPALRYGAMAAICALLVWNAQYRLSRFMLHEDSKEAMEVLREIRADGLTDKTLVAPRGGVPTFHYYFPHMRVLGYDSETQIPQLRNQADAVLYPDSSLRMNTPAGRM